MSGCCRAERNPSPDRTIRAARADDVPSLIAIERAAGETFRALGMDLVADDDPESAQELVSYVDGARAFVAVDAAAVPVGYLLLDVVDGSAHIDQASILPEHARRGIGRALLERAAEWAAENTLKALTLTTYVEVPWNGPYYERLGFRYLRPDEETTGLRAIRDGERASGLDAWPRACMRRDLG